MVIKKFRHTIKYYGLIAKNDKIVVGVSGGPDSVTLLYLLNNLKKELNLTLHIAHLDHMLRKDSDADRRFVHNLAIRLKLPITSAQVNVAELVKKGSVEEIARNVRLGFLFSVAKKIKARKIALGHNFDDQAETVLMRILRGAGLCGLSAMLPKREISGYQIIRPLIEIRRKEIETFLKSKKITPRRDVSNAQDIYLRNRIRNSLLPLLEKDYNKSIKEVLVNIADSVGFDYDYLMRAAHHKAGKIGRNISLDKLSKLHPSMRRLILRLAISSLKGDTRKIDFRHIKEIEDLILSRPVNAVVDLPKGISVIKRKKNLSFYHR